MVFLITLRKENFQTWLKKWQDRWGHHVQREQEYSGGLMEASLYSMSLHAWDWEDEDSESNGPASSYPSFYRFESDAEDYLRAPAHEPDFENPNSSIESFDASTFDPDVPRVVPCDLIISLALPANTDHKGKHTSLIDKYRKPPKSHNHMAKLRRFYHIEYFFLPDDEEPKKVDVVVFPGLARVFLESGIKTVRPWCEDDKLWVSWSQTFNVNVTKELLKKLNFHKIILRIWDTKDKISKKFQYCHPLKTLSDDLGSLEEVRHLVLNQRELSELALEKANVLREGRNEASLLEKQEKAEKGLKSLPAELETSSRNSKEYEKPLKADDLPTFRTSRASPTSFMGTTMMEIKELIDRTSFSSLNTLERPRSQIKGRDFEIKKKSHKRMKKPSAIKDRGSMVSGCWGQSALCIQLAVTPLLAGQQAVMSRGSEKSANILDCLLTLKTEVPIMTEEQKQDLNPMTIKIECASCLPSQPVPIQELERLCTPVYCRYQFHKTPVHQTKGEPHGTHIYFHDINVIFLGAMHPSELREYLEGPPMVVEVHDRDRKSEESSQKPILFGEDPLHSHLNLQVFISPADTENNPFESQKKLWDPYGVARVSFANLLLGHKYLNLVVPIHSCEPESTGCAKGSKNRRPDVLQHSPMPMGCYLEANSQLKLRVGVAVPLSTMAEAPQPDLMDSPFGRIIFVFSFKKLFLLHNLLHDITTINAKALELDSYPIRNVQQILSAFKMRVKVQDQPSLDVLTGFHVLDGTVHLFVLEGLAEQGLKQLWNSHQSRIPKSQHGEYKVLYNSKLLFRRRLYADLETVVYHVRLSTPMAQLMRQQAFYVRNAVPRTVFQALARIYDICHTSTRLKEVIVRDLLPSSAMIKDLNQEFGVPILQEDLTDGKLLALPPQPAPNLEAFRSRGSTLTTEILAHQEKYLQWRATMLQRSGCQASLVQRNIREAYESTKKLPTSVVKVLRISPAAKAIHNYSIQTLNSSELAKKELYREMAKEPRKRFTYSQNYLSAMVEPQDTEEEEKKAQKKSRQAWLTAVGFQVTGLQNSTESHHRDFSHPPIEELKEEWTERALFANVLKPTLDRGRWSWDKRHLDFELYKKAPPVLELPPAPAPKPPMGGRPKALALSPS
ncbi:uncharacterized protein KIAA1257 homolog isoform X2 [Fukomys damarensis]|uniref:uncharacterized protein KIAA1257 homolog isoform X2 n=1 Tax=Fukomys damarensis TaxID=885580 RepID=UPI00053FCACC|nr:uncharacterized protein KIAA1257 homolog isoform X2 [Fukomys damarensis]